MLHEAGFAPGLRQEFESFFNRDLSRVRLRAVSGRGANGFARPATTIGETIFIDAELYDFEPARKFLLAHELAHVVQKLNFGAAATGDPAQLETEAQDAARRFLRAQPCGALSADLPSAPRHFGPAGHYYTTFYMMLAAGAHPMTAAKVAFYAQIADEIAEIDATDVILTWLPRCATAQVGGLLYDNFLQIYPREAINIIKRSMFLYVAMVQRGLHCLTGEDSAKEQAKRAKDLEQTSVFDFAAFGMKLHSLGDSFAHQTIDKPEVLFKTGLGHAIEGLRGLYGGNQPDTLDVLLTAANPSTAMLRALFNLDDMNAWMHKVDKIGFQPQKRYRLYASTAFSILRRVVKGAPVLGDVLDWKDFNEDIVHFSPEGRKENDYSLRILTRILERWKDSAKYIDNGYLSDPPSILWKDASKSPLLSSFTKEDFATIVALASENAGLKGEMLAIVRKLLMSAQLAPQRSPMVPSATPKPSHIARLRA